VVDPIRAPGVPEGPPPEDLGAHAPLKKAELNARPVWTAATTLSYALLLLVVAVTGGVSASLPRLAVGAAVVAVGSRVRGAFAGDGLGPARLAGRPWHVAQFANRVVFWSVAGLALELGIPKFVGPAYTPIKVVVAVCLVVLLGCALAPRRAIHWGPNMLLAAGTIFLAVQLVRVLGPAPASAVVLDSPLDEMWIVANGGRSALVNGHWNFANQRHALDLTYAHPDSMAGDLTLEGHPCWERPVRAPAAGRITEVEEGLRDLEIGKMDRGHPAGNHVVIHIGGGRFVVLAHLRQDSVPVAVGDPVTAGQIVGRCGNSGNTSEPHLHIHVQDRPTAYDPAARTTPMVFRNVNVRRNRRTFHTDRGDLRRNDEVARSR